MSRDLQQRISALRSVEKRFQPEDAWVKATRETLLKQVRNSLPTESLTLAAQAKQLFRHFIPNPLIQFFRGPLVATLSILAVALGGSVASVSAAEQSLPGDFLYSLKLATEQARLVLTPAKDEKLKLKVEFTSRRGDELKDVAKADGPSKPERVVQAAEILKRDLNTLQQQLEDVRADSDSESDKVVEVAKLVDQTTNELVQTLQLTKSELGAETKEKVTDAQAAAADTGVKAIEVLFQEHQESSESITEGDVVKAIEGHNRMVADATVEGSIVAPATIPALAVPTIVSSTSPLIQAVENIKTATQQAFAAQKTAEKTAAGASSTPALPELQDPATSSGTSTVPPPPSTSTSTSIDTPTSSTNTTTPL